MSDELIARRNRLNQDQHLKTVAQRGMFLLAALVAIILTYRTLQDYDGWFTTPIFRSKDGRFNEQFNSLFLSIVFPFCFFGIGFSVFIERWWVNQALIHQRWWTGEYIRRTRTFIASVERLNAAITADLPDKQRLREQMKEYQRQVEILEASRPFDTPSRGTGHVG